MTTTEHTTNARSRRTRAALLDAARAILDAQGFAGLTMTAAADRAGVTRRSAYLHFATRGALVAALFDHIAAADDLAGSLKQIWDAPDALVALDRWAAHLARYHPKVIAVDRAISAVEGTDPDAAAHRARVSEAQRANCDRLSNWLAREDRLATPWDTQTASDALFGLIATDMIARLLEDCGWSRPDLTERLALLFRRTLTE